MDLGTHAGFILASYAFTALVMGALVLNAVRDRRAQTRALRSFDALRGPEALRGSGTLRGSGEERR